MISKALIVIGGGTRIKGVAKRIHYVLKRRKAKRGMVAMCIAGGMGAAGIFEMM